MRRFSVVYYSNGKAPEALLQYCFRTLASVTEAAGGELVCVTWEPVELRGARNLVWTRHVPTHRNLYEQILAGVAEATTNLVALAEHDVLYPAGYHDALLASAGAGLCYNTNFWRLNSRGYFRDPNQRLLSNCGGPREALVRGIEAKLDEIRRQGKLICAEPAGDAEISSPLPTVDIRHGGNFTGDREPPDGSYLQSVEYWGACGKYTRLFTAASDSPNASTTSPRTQSA